MGRAPQDQADAHCHEDCGAENQQQAGNPGIFGVSRVFPGHRKTGRPEKNDCRQKPQKCQAHSVAVVPWNDDSAKNGILIEFHNFQGNEGRMKNQADKTAAPSRCKEGRIGNWLLALGFSAAVLWTTGCATAPARVTLSDSDRSFEIGTILSGKSGRSVSYETMVADLAGARIVYVGENHRNPDHHRIQHRLMASLHRHHPQLNVGMEMFDRTYQPVLDLWSAGEMEEDDFLKKTQWYANWRFPYPLYRDLLDFIRSRHLPLFALNLPGYIPPRIRVAGTANLNSHDSAFLPAEIDLTHEAHRRYLESVFQRHAFGGDARFEYFYQAQCVWEETMAETIARSLTTAPMLVLAGNSHIQYHYGIPDRAFRRTGVPFRTVYLAAAGESVELSVADYIWVTPDSAFGR